jgi:dipeptidyl aminopeptidase/acylaminoacyl peptidase
MVATSVGAGEDPLTFLDLMKFRQIRDASISQNGEWVAYSLVPDRGDPEAVVRSTTSKTEYRIERGVVPEVSADESWAVAALEPTLEEREKAKVEKGETKSDDGDEPKKGLAIVELATGGETRIDRVESFALSADGRWLAYKMYEEESDDETTDEFTGEPVESGEPELEEDEEKPKEELGTTLVLRELASAEQITIEHVIGFAFAEETPILGVGVSAPEGEGNRAMVYDLSGEAPTTTTLHAVDNSRYTHLSWAREAEHLAFVSAVVDEDGEPGDAELWVWTGGDEARRVASKDDAPDGFTLPSKNELQWSRDGQRLFFGFKPVEDADTDTDADEGEGEEEAPFDPYDVEAILEDRGVDVWHWKDPRIIPNQKERWEEHEKDRVFRTVVHLDDGLVVPLADREMPLVLPSDSPNTALGFADVPYLREITWDGRFADLFVVDLRTGERTAVARRVAAGRWRTGSLSPDGGSVLFYLDGDWHLFDVKAGETRNLTADLGVSFADQDWDYPADPPGYGHSEWYADSSAVMLYAKYDIWKIPIGRPDPLRGGAPFSLIGSPDRSRETVYRVVDLDPETDTIDPRAPSLILGYHDREKHDGFFGFEGDFELVELYGDGNHRLKFVAKAEKADRVLFTRERYDEFPDLWVADRGFANPTRISDANLQIAEFAWGAAELVEWTTDDGVELQGVLIRPTNLEPGTRVPVVVYYYRFFSDRLHLFNEPVVNHRPSFPVYASHGYAVFLPDIRFQVGRPGPSATSCLVSGVQKLVDMGIADPDAIGLHGHSWSGYQTAYVVTQTDVFAAAVAGAPVSNMTSAYSGIRWGTGLARQFQYERSQSRIGGSLWEVPQLYIENSPVFFADEISTPLLIQFGDEDEAVPWYQGIELYLACRRLDKDCIMLQYRGEPHHLKQYANKLDYSIKMKQFFDHHLKGEPAPEWMTDGVPYRGE